MFSSFFNKKESSPIPASHHSNHHPQKQEVEVENDVNDGDSESKISNLELSVEMGGGKGWTVEATCILYHRIQVLLQSSSVIRLYFTFVSHIIFFYIYIIFRDQTLFHVCLRRVSYAWVHKVALFTFMEMDFNSCVRG